MHLDEQVKTLNYCYFMPLNENKSAHLMHRGLLYWFCSLTMLSESNFFIKNCVSICVFIFSEKCIASFFGSKLAVSAESLLLAGNLGKKGKPYIRI